MKQMTIDRIFTLIRWGCIWLILLLSSQMGLFSLHVAAQGPTPVPTATSAPTWTPVPGATSTPTTVPAGPTPTSGPSPTPTGRLVNFRVDNDEIDEGECVLFSWVVRGDVAWVEFNEVDDGNDPVLVEDQAERQECPDNDTEYELIVTWLDSSSTTNGIEITVHTAGDGSNGGSGGPGGGPVPTPGPFVPVTPIPLSAVLATPISGNTDGNSGSSTPPPVGLLASIVALPETGMLPSASTPSAPPLKRVEPTLKVAAPQPWLAFTGRMVMVLGGVSVGLLLLVRFLRQSP
jgi:hypothetical protein